MDIVIFVMLLVILLACGVLAKDYQFIGMLAGIGIVMLAMTLQTSGLEVATGINITQVTNVTDTVVVNYSDMFTYYAGLSFLREVLTLVIAGIGVLFVLYSIK